MLSNDQQRELTARWTRTQPLVYSFLRSAVGSAEEADELMQRVAFVLVDKYDRYDPERPFAPWALGVARFELLDHRRKRKNSRVILGGDVIEQLAEEAQQVEPDISRMRGVLDQCIKKLSPRRREVLSMRYVDQRSNEEIATQLGVGQQSAVVLLSRIRAALRRCVRTKMGVEQEWI